MDGDLTPSAEARRHLRENAEYISDQAAVLAWAMLDLADAIREATQLAEAMPFVRRRRSAG